MGWVYSGIYGTIGPQWLKMSEVSKAKINNMLVSGNMTPQKMGRKVGKKKYFKKIFLPHILFNDPFVSHSTTKKQRCGRSEFFIFIFYFFWSSSLYLYS